VCIYTSFYLCGFREISTSHFNDSFTITFAFICIPRCRSIPWSIVIKWLALLAISSTSVVFAFTFQLSFWVFQTTWCMSIALTSPTYWEIGECVCRGAWREQRIWRQSRCLFWRVIEIPVLWFTWSITTIQWTLQTMKDNTNVSCSNPILLWMNIFVTNFT
jgi:hypothetical protein